MRICIDARSPGRGGVLTYSRQFLTALHSIDKKNEYLLITDPVFGGWGFDGVEEITVPNTNPLSWFVWSNTKLPAILRERRIDVYHSLKHLTWFRPYTKSMITFHGAGMIYRFPKLYKLHDLYYWRIMYRLAARRYDRIITATHSEGAEFQKYSGLVTDKFRVCPFAASERFSQAVPASELSKTRSRLELPERFILFVGRFHPIKNIENVIKAFAAARTRLPEDYSLVIAAACEGAHFLEIKNQVSELGVADHVRFLGRVVDDLPNLYRLADLFLFPSLHENFGIVLLEAMKAGLPVITSAIPDLEEVVEDAAIRVDPYDVNGITEAVVQVLNSPDLRDSLASKSLERARIFSWEKCARDTLHVYEELGK